MSTEAQRRASKKYTAANTKQIALVLNIKTDADIIEHLQKQANKQGYIKELIRRDIEEEKKIMKKWYLIDWKDGDMWNEQMDAETKEEAEEELFAAWNRLTPREQKHRQSFFAIYTTTDEEGNVDFDAADDEIKMK